MPWTRALYPPDWEQITFQVKEEAGWKCVWCGQPNDPKTPGCTLTTHHLDGDPANCARKNLAALCQVCHLHDEARVKRLKRYRTQLKLAV